MQPILWHDQPSQLQHLLLYLSCVLVLPLPWALWQYLRTRTTQYTLTPDRLIMSTGILHRQQDEVELYRVKDYSVATPWLYRGLGIANIYLLTSDKTHPELELHGIRNAGRVKELIRTQVELLRTQKGVREID
ncbi:PH domain-containing protein [Tunicatimonas pelagia]|uniref:PH domain-containing protein n=1 Tax=Tunicatimonas pelagia TaxID=931531 RepID=UPI0026668428|nr:PH domain-containing protein [Tunicatimonas pelagia]WKN42733.1 PH domain-containing protein [Tunicatimonas pelagia]